MIKVLLDTNVVLDVMLERDPSSTEAKAIAQADAEGRIEAYVSATSITDVYYVSRKVVGAEKARVILRRCLDDLQIVSVTHDMLDAAEQRGGSDFEDDLQIECAALACLDAIVTRDPKDFAGSIVPILTPTELVARVSSGEST
jgi:predicted nucleic acid-binding protein